MVEIIKAGSADIEDLMSVRLEMLKVVNNLDAQYEFNESLVKCSPEYFLNGDQTTVLAKDGDRVVGCASVSYITVMPTFSHPTGKRAHLMNVYINKDYRRQGLARKMVSMLLEEAKSKGCTEMSLDATEDGFPLYKSLGFNVNAEGMTLQL